MMESYRLLLADLLTKLFEPEVRNFKQQINRLIDDNNKLLGVVMDGFHYLGTNYGRDGNIV
mgnify:CR=1 FL=1